MSEAAGVAETIRGVVREALGVPWTAWVTYLVAGASTFWFFHVLQSTADGEGIQLPLASLLELLTRLELGPPTWLQEFANWFDRIGPQLLGVLWLASAAFLLIGATYANTGGLQAALGQLLLLLACEAAGSLWPFLWVLLIGGLVAVVTWIAGMAYDVQRRPRHVARRADEVFITLLVLTVGPAYLLMLLVSTGFRIVHYEYRPADAQTP